MDLEPVETQLGMLTWLVTDLLRLAEQDHPKRFAKLLEEAREMAASPPPGFEVDYARKQLQARLNMLEIVARDGQRSRK